MDFKTSRKWRVQRAFTTDIRQRSHKMVENINNQNDDARLNAQNNYWARHFAAKAVCDAALAVATTPEQRQAAYAAFDAARELATREFGREMARLW